MNRIRYVVREYWFELLIAVLAIAGILELVVGRDLPGAPATSLWFSVPAMAVLVLPLVAHRRFPFAAPAAYWLMAAALTFVDGLLIPFVGSLGVVGLAAAFLLGNLRDDRQAGIGLAIVLGCIVVVVSNIPGPQSASDLIFIPLRFVVAWVAGYALRARAEQAEAAETRATLAEREREAAEMRATLAEREREAAARIAVAEERTRIARELHDIVAHAMSVMVLQIGAVRHRLPQDLEEDRDALGRVEQAGRTALTEMRRLLGAMRSDGDGVELGPQPGLNSLDSLVEDVSRAGLPVQLHVDGEPYALPRSIDLSAYRIVQERRRDRPLPARRARARSRRRRQGPREYQRPRPRPRRHPRTREDLRRRDERGTCTGGWLHPQRTPTGRPLPAMSIRVLVADDQSMVRAGFRMLLSGEPDIEVVAEASNGIDAIDKAARFHPTVVLMDIRMPELDGLEATRRILAADETARILILTTFDLDEYVYEALRAGASGFVLKDDPPDQLLAAIRIVAGGEALLSPAITKRVIEKFTRISHPEPPKELDELTERELDVLRLIARGLSNAEIGQELYISDATVKTHITHILQKLNLRDRVQAVVLAHETRLFAADEQPASSRDERPAR
jgi:DNA-binding NarL/FixJ family response regulator/signal transduction histidine kinase